MLRGVVVGVVAIGCHHDAGPTPPSNRVAASDRAAAGDVLGYLPIDAEIVVALDAAQLRSGALWHTYLPKLEHALGSDLTRLVTTCGFDPLQTVTGLAAGLKLLPHGQATGVVVVHGVGAGVLECLGKEAARVGAMTTDRGVVITGGGDKLMTASTVVGGDTLVLEVAPLASHDTLEAVLARGAPLRKSPAFMKLYDHLERGVTAWGVVNASPPEVDQQLGLGLHPRWIDGTVTITDRVVMVGRMTLASDAAATQVATMASSAMASGKAMFERLEVTTAGSVVTLHVVATAVQVQQLAGMLAGGLFGGP